MITCFERSRDELVTVRFDFSLWTNFLAASYVEMRDAQVAFIAAAAAHRARWRTLSIYFENDKQRVDAAECLQDIDVPLLESLAVRLSCDSNREGEDADGNRIFCKIFNKGAPALRTIKSEGLPLIWFMPPLGSTTELDDHPDEDHTAQYTRQTFHSALLAPVNLQRLSLSSIKIIGDEDLPSGTVDLPNLTSLSIGRDALRACALVCAPQLKILEIECAKVSDLTVYLDHLSKTPGPRFPLLETLSLDNVECESAQNSSKLLLEFPRLNTLTFVGKQRGLFVAALRAIKKSGTVAVLPKLRNLTVPSLSWTSFFDLVMIRAQSDRNRALKCVKLDAAFMKDIQGETKGAIAAWAHARGVTLLSGGGLRYHGDAMWARSVKSWKHAPKDWTTWDDEKLRAHLEMTRKARVEAERKARDRAEAKKTKEGGDKMEVDG